MSKDTTVINMTVEAREKLKKIGNKGETYAQVVERLIKEAGYKEVE